MELRHLFNLFLPNFLTSSSFAILICSREFNLQILTGFSEKDESWQ